VVTLCVVGYLIYMFVGIMGLGHLCDKYLNDDKVCVACIHYGLAMAWTFIPFTLMIDLRG